MSTHNYRVNDRIRIREVRLIDEEGTNLGVMATRDAREYATTKGLDLVEVAPEARPPVCRVMDYGKFMYEQAKKERAARKTQKQVEIKGIRIRPDTDSYHIGFKVKQARGFLLKGNKVRVSCLFRGRERSHPEIARNLMKDIAEKLSDIAVVEQYPNFEGRNMTMLLAPDTVALERMQAAAKAAKKRADREARAAAAGSDGVAASPDDELLDEEPVDEEAEALLREAEEATDMEPLDDADDTDDDSFEDDEDEGDEQDDDSFDDADEDADDADEDEGDA